MFTSPSGMAMAGRNLYVSDTNNSTIRKITLPGGVVTPPRVRRISLAPKTATGSAAHFNLPTQIAVDPNGSRLFLTDTNNSLIRMIQLPDMVVKTIAGQAQTEGKAEDRPPNRRSTGRAELRPTASSSTSLIPATT